MFFANDENGARIHIDDAQRGKNYCCPACKEPLIMKRGRVVAHHFAHIAKKSCDPWYTEKMSEWHRRLQSLFPQDSQERIVWNKENTEYHIADVLFEYNDKTYVLEFQHSPISRREFDARSMFYLNLGYRLYWIFDFCECDTPKRIYISNVDSEAGLMTLEWPGRDRIRFLDNIDLFDYNEDGYLHVVFHVSVGTGECVEHYNPYGYSWTTWEYINPSQQYRCFVEPNFFVWENLCEFEVVSYREEEFLGKMLRFAQNGKSNSD